MVFLLPIGLMLAAQAPSAGASPPATRAGLSWTDSDSLSRKLEAIERQRKTGKPGPAQTVTVSERELNSYLNLGLGPKMPAGVSDVEVSLERDRVALKAQLDLEQLQGKSSRGTWGPFALLAGRVPAYIKGRIPNQDGFGSLEVEEVRLAGMPVPVSLLEQLVASATKSAENPQGFDIGAPFRLPYSLRRLRLQAGRAFLDF